MPTRLVGLLDIPILLLVVSLSIAVWMQGPGAKGARATAFVGGKPAAWWPLTGSVRKDTVTGALGSVVVEHGDGAIRIVQAPCPNHICLKQGKASHQHDQLVCVPSRVVIVIDGESETSGSQLDAVH
jgi:hypothetical protein